MHWISQEAVEHLPAGAAIITTASIQAYDPSAILLDYATTKAGIVAYTKALAAQLMEKGIRANVVAPGPFGVNETKPAPSFVLLPMIRGCMGL